MRLIRGLLLLLLCPGCFFGLDGNRVTRTMDADVDQGDATLDTSSSDGRSDASASPDSAVDLQDMSALDETSAPDL